MVGVPYISCAVCVCVGPQVVGVPHTSCVVCVGLQVVGVPHISCVVCVGPQVVGVPHTSCDVCVGLQVVGVPHTSCVVCVCVEQVGLACVKTRVVRPRVSLQVEELLLPLLPLLFPLSGIRTLLLLQLTGKREGDGGESEGRRKEVKGVQKGSEERGKKVGEG